MDDLLRQCEREEEDLRMEIERERVLAGALDGSIQGNPILSSTPNRNMDPVGNSSKPIEVSERTATFAPPSRWPKIIVEKFNGDPRKWQRFAHGIHATVRDANIPDSYKFLGLQDNITEDIRKRMGHIFNGSNAFESAWNELEIKYGNPGLIMQAHNQHLLQVQPFKSIKRFRCTLKGIYVFYRHHLARLKAPNSASNRLGKICILPSSESAIATGFRQMD